MRRADAALPPPDGDLTDFPSSRRPGLHRLYRSHRSDREPWHFSHTLGPAGGRFDLPAPAGTCYAATDLATAVREGLGAVLGATNAVEEDLARSRTVSRVSVRRGVCIAEAGHPDAVRFGAMRQLSAGTDYSTTQRWAARLHDAGFDAIRYESRFTSAARPAALAVFGPLPVEHLGWERASDLPGVDACRAAGIRILPAALDDAGALVIEPDGPVPEPGPAATTRRSPPP